MDVASHATSAALPHAAPAAPFEQRARMPPPLPHVLPGVLVGHGLLILHVTILALPPPHLPIRGAAVSQDSSTPLELNATDFRAHVLAFRYASGTHANDVSLEVT